MFSIEYYLVVLLLYCIVFIAATMLYNEYLSLLRCPEAKMLGNACVCMFVGALF